MTQGARTALRLSVVALLLAAAAAGAQIARRGTAPERRGLDALVTAGSDLVHDASHPVIDLTRLSTDDEVRLGAAIDARARAGMTLEPQENAGRLYLAAILARLVTGADRRDVPYAVDLVRTDEVNGWAVAGGRLYVTDGMLRFATNEAETAVVLGHELAHVDLRHTVERLQIERTARRIAPDLEDLAALGFDLMRLGYSEEQELAADARGAVLAAGAGYDAWQAAALFARMQRREGTQARGAGHDPMAIAVLAVPRAIETYLATHPPCDQRIEAVRRALVARPELWKGIPRIIGASGHAKYRSTAAAANAPYGDLVVRPAPPAPDDPGLREAAAVTGA